MITIHISKNISIVGLDRAVKSHIQKTLTLPNPVYHKMMRKGNLRAAMGAGRDFKYWKEEKGELIIPRGMRSRLLGLLDKIKLVYELKEDFVFIKLKV